MKVGIVGAGAAGLAAAYDICKDGHEVVIYESAPFIGGQASTIKVGGHPLERGYHHLFTNDLAILELMQELNIEHHMQWYETNVGTYANNRLYPTTTAMDLLKFGALPIWERIRMGLFTLRLKRMSEWRQLEEFTADGWLRERLGGTAYRVMWEPLLRAKFREVLRTGWDAVVLVQDSDAFRFSTRDILARGAGLPDRKLRCRIRKARIGDKQTKREDTTTDRGYGNRGCG